MTCSPWHSGPSASSSTPTSRAGNDLLISGDACYHLLHDLNRRNEPMPHFPKPAAGTWTEHFGLDTAPASYDDSISPEHYELEREAIFQRTWLNVGPGDQV